VQFLPNLPDTGGLDRARGVLKIEATIVPFEIEIIEETP
jgi:hypothetical protein